MKRDDVWMEMGKGNGKLGEGKLNMVNGYMGDSLEGDEDIMGEMGGD